MFKRPVLNTIGQQVNWASSQARGLVAFWPLNEQSYSLAYEFVNRNHAAPTGNIPYPSATSPFGQARYPERAGARFFDCGNVPILDFGTGNFSISVWVRPFLVTAGRNEMVLAKWGTTAANGTLQLYLNSANAGDVNLEFRDASTNSNGASTGTILSAYRHYNIVAIRRASVIEIWVNGALIPSTPFGNPALALQTSTATVRIGNRTSGTSATNFEGPMSMLQVYNRALTSAEIKDHYINPNGIWLPSNPKPRVFTQVYSLGGISLKKKPRLNVVGNVLDYNSSLTKGLLAYWPLNELSAGANGVNCVRTVRSGATMSQSGNPTVVSTPHGLARNFVAASSQFMNAGAIQLLDGIGTGDFAFAFLMQVTNTTLGMIITRQGDADNQFSIRHSGGELQLYIFGAVGTTSNFYRITTTTPIVPGKTLSVVVQRVSGTIKIYVNAVEQATTSGSASGGTEGMSIAQPVSASVQIGARQLSAARNFYSGSLSHVAIYDRALSQKEISDFYINPNAIWKAYQLTASTPLRYPVNLGGVRIARRTPLNVVGNVLDYSSSQTRGLVAFWPLNETGSDSNAIEYVRRQDGTLSGHPAPYILPIGVGKSFLSASTQYVTCGDSRVLDFGTGDFAISFFIRPETLPASNVVIISKDNTSTVRQLSVRMSQGIAGDVAIFIFQSASVYAGVYTSAAQLSIGKTSHVVCQRRSGSLNIYVNNFPVAISPSSGGGGTQDLAIASTAADLRIGTNAATANLLNARLAHLKVYNRALTTSEIQDHYINPNGIWKPKSITASNTEGNPWLYNRIQRGQ